MNTLNLLQKQPTDSNLPADNFAQMAYEVMGSALARLGQPNCPNCAGTKAPDKVGDIDTTSPISGIPNFGSWFTPDANPQTAAVGGPQTAAPVNAAAPGEKAQGGEGQWSAEDEQALDRAIGGAAGGAQGAGPAAGADGAQYDQLFSQFGQSQEGNCASVAVIKAALDKYKGKVFNQVTKAGDGYKVQMQDGKSVDINKSELGKAAGAAKFKGKASEAKSMAVLMFAVIAKNLEKEGGGSFEESLKKLDNGFDPKKAAKLLGLGDKIRDVNPNEAKNGDAVVAWNSKHAVYSDSGKTDSYGQARQADGSDTRGHALTNAFTFA